MSFKEFIGFVKYMAFVIGSAITALFIIVGVMAIIEMLTE